MPGKFVQRGIKIKVPFLTLLEKTNRPLTFRLGQLQAPHQLLGGCYFSLCHPPVHFIDVSKCREHRTEECIPGTVGTTEPRQEPVHYVTQENPKYRAHQTASHQADDAAYQFPPPMAGYFKTGVIRQTEFPRSN